MATQTTNYNLSKPDSTDPFSQFRQSYNDNMDIIDANLGGGGGSGGHTIIDENDTPMTQRTGLQFTGNVSVSDDAVNDKTVVDIKGGTVYGAFLDPDRVVYSGFTFDSSTHSWTATEDVILTDNMTPPDGSTAYFIRIDGKQVFAGYNTVEDPFVYVRKGQVVEYRAKSGSTMKAYGIIQGTNGIFAPVIYSDTERVIGVWRDNKPLYQRTFVLSSPITVNGSGTLLPNDIQTALADVEIMVDSECARDSTYSAFISPYVYKSGGQWYILSADNWGNVKFITLRYTKTTDVAGSGNWNTDGVPTVHYSTSEQVIGTWYNGKPIYQKVLTPTVGAGYNSLAHGISNLDECIKIWGTCKYNNRAEWLSLPYVSTALNYEITLGNVTASNYILEAGTGFTSFEDVRIVIEYTKTTD